MTQQNGQGQRLSEQEKNALELLLEGRSDTFKAKVLELVVRNGWDVNEPSFQLLVATGQLEVLLEIFPQQFEALFRRLLRLQQERFQEIRQWLDTQKVDIKGYLQGVEATGSQLISGVKDQVTELRQFTTSQRTQIKQDIGEVLVLAQQERDKLHQDLAAALKVASQKHLAAVEDQANTLIENAGTKLRGKYLKELMTPVVIAAAVVFGIGGLTGWTFHKAAMGELDPAGPRQLSLEQWQSLQWAVSQEGQLAHNLIEWNQPNLSECIAGQGVGNESLGVSGYEERPIKYGNCALWVVPPGKRQFGSKPSQ